MTTTSRPAVIVGAGPYGLSIASHLQARGVPVRIFGEVMGSWRNQMPAGMCLKSTPWASSLGAPEPGSTLADFQAAHGIPKLRDDEVVPLEQFIRYGEWFAGRLTPEVEPSMVHWIEKRGDGFLVRLDTGENIAARSVVLANGLAGFAHVPAELAAIAPDGASPFGLVSHSSHHHQLAEYAGRQVAVIGAGQSALESAALLHESGADVQLVAREPIRFGDPPADPDRQAHSLLPAPRTPLGPSWGLYPFSYLAGGFRYLPERARLRLVRKVLGPLGAWWLADRVNGKFPVHEGYRLEEAYLDGAKAALRLVAEDGHRFTVRTDHVLAATGYRPDVSKIGFLSPGLRARLQTPTGSPRLSASFESDVPGLYVVSLAAAATFGPLMRFVCGTPFTARRVSAAISARSRTGSRTDRAPQPA
ncbi:MAG: NAD(P)/FAD-dependent oxidoreductase [Streptosporangiaceae bacterium]|jgi:thioredoxin reductase